MIIDKLIAVTPNPVADISTQEYAQPIGSKKKKKKEKREKKICPTDRPPFTFIPRKYEEVKKE